jgi:hypothetical protein
MPRSKDGSGKIAKKYIIELPWHLAEKFDQILIDEQMTADEWLTNMMEDYDC